LQIVQDIPYVRHTINPFTQLPYSVGYERQLRNSDITHNLVFSITIRLRYLEQSHLHLEPRPKHIREHMNHEQVCTASASDNYYIAKVRKYNAKRSQCKKQWAILCKL
jgi:hypothetical protein